MRRSRGTGWALALAGAVACGGGGRSEAERAVDSRTAPAAATPASAPAVPRETRRVLFLGTSLTSGLGLDPDSAYPALIQRKIDSAGLPYVVTNAGVSGETSAGLLRRLDWVLRQPAQVIVVETGANDGLRGQPVAATKAVIGQILDRIRREHPQAAVALVQMEAPTNLGAQYTTRFHAMFPELAAEKGVTLLSFLLDSVAGVPALNQADGIHPNGAGERIVAENVWRGLRGLLGGTVRR